MSEKILTVRSRSRRWLFIGLYPVYLLLLAWLGAQGFWLLQEWKTGHSKTDVWAFYYLKLPAVRDADIRKDDQTLDVLLLGGSVLEQIAPVFEQTLIAKMDQPVRVFSVSTAAHTSRDSFLKFGQLRDKPFDLIVIYHGINDVRMNCVSDDLYQEDYTHCWHYRSLKRAAKAGSLSTAGLLRAGTENAISLRDPDVANLKYGGSIKTPPAFRANLEGVLNGAAVNATPVVLMTFAYWMPEDYSKQRFLEKALGYGKGFHELPVELWGLKDNVVATIQAHNREIEDLARTNEVIFVDQAKLMPPDGQHFSDICHFTETGCRKFVENLMPVLRNGIASRIASSVTD